MPLHNATTNQDIFNLHLAFYQLLKYVATLQLQKEEDEKLVEVERGEKTKKVPATSARNKHGKLAIFSS
jgi:hypothetical protein